MGSEAPSRWPDLRRELWPLLELLILCGFVFGQPLFDVTGRSPEFFVFRHVGTATILLMVAAVTLLPGLALWLLELLSGLLGERVRRLVHLALVTGLLGLLAVEVLKKLTPLRGKRLALLALVAACAAALLYARRPAVRLWLRYLAPAPLVFALLFTTVSPASKLVLPQPSSASAQVSSRTPIVMVLFDEFPLQSLLDSAGRIDTRLFPNFARLAGDSTWYRNATGVSGLTTNAVPAVLTGQYPTKSKVPLYSAYPDNLFSLLGRSYDLKVLESVTRLCPPDLCSGTGAAVEHPTTLPSLLKDVSSVWAKIVNPRNVQEDVTAQFAEATAGGQAGSGAGATPAPKVQFGVVMNNKPVRWDDFVNAIKAPAPSAKPPLYFIHILLPHPPWSYLPSGRTYPYPLDTFGLHAGKTWETNSWTSEAWPVQLAHERHMLQLAYTDTLIGQLLDRLESQGMYDKSMVVLTADHGNSFTPGQPRRILTDRNAGELMWVPLFLKAPGQARGRVDDRNWEHVDLLPTMADMLGVRVPWRVDGLSQAGAPARQRTQKYFYNSPGARSVVDGPRNQALALHGVTDRVGRPEQGQAGLFKVAPEPGDLALLGLPLTRMRIGGSSGRSAVLDHPQTFQRAADLTKGTVPAQVAGALRQGGAGTAAPLKLVFAVNGTIGAVGETFHEGDDPMKFAAMVPDSLFKQGANRLQMFVLDGGGAGGLLHPVSLGGGA